MVSVGAVEAVDMDKCNHEEADTRVIVHIIHSLAQGSRSVNVRTVDTDVVVILIGKFHDLKMLKNDLDLWASFGVGKQFRQYHINSICAWLGQKKCRGLPNFHAFTGSDTTSAFRGKGKVSAWKAWQAYPEVTSTFEELFINPFHKLDESSHHFKILEKFTVVLYDKNSEKGEVNLVRRDLFCQKQVAMDNLPPTKVSLIQIQLKFLVIYYYYTFELLTHDIYLFNVYIYFIHNIMFSLLCRIPCCSMLVAQFIRVAFGLSQINHK